MKQLINLSSYPQTLEQYNEYPGGLRGFLHTYGLDGIELIQAGPHENALFPHGHIRGLHLPFWLDWIDFFEGNQAGLKRRFPDQESLQYYYGSSAPDVFTDTWRRELRHAQKFNADYVVVHVSHNTMPSCYTYTFDDSDEAVVDSFIRLINQATEGLPAGPMLLMENLWWPGLNFIKPELAGRLLSEIHYPKKGFVLDIGHLMNTEHSLQSEQEAVAYCMKIIGGLGPVAGHIRTIHLSSSLSGAYVKDVLQEQRRQGAGLKAEGLSPLKPPAHFDEFKKQCWQCGEHIRQIDRHMPFQDPAINALIQQVKPEYLVHELMADSFEELEAALRTQCRTVGAVGKQTLIR
jgi:hypothetical protein